MLYCQSVPLAKHVDATWSTAALAPPATRCARWRRSTSWQPATQGVQEPLRPCYHWLIGGRQCCWNCWWRGGQLLLVVATACTSPFTCCAWHVSAPESMKCLPRDRGAARPWWPMILLWPPCLLLFNAVLFYTVLCYSMLCCVMLYIGILCY